MARRSDHKTMSVEEQPAVSANPLAGDPELLNDFILESREHLTSIELQLLTLDQDPGNTEAIHAIFRGVHTIKGMAGFLDLDSVREVSHEVETILDLARNGALEITGAVIDRMLESKDYLNRCLTELELMLQTGQPPAATDQAGLIEGIRSLSTGGGVLQLAREVTAAAGEPSADVAGVPAPGNPEAAKVMEAKTDGARSIKVDTGKLDYLVDMVGEMVIAQSLVKHDPDLAAGLRPRLARNLSQLARITDDVQRTAMSMRMIPVGQLFQKTGRLVRDLSRKYGKQVDLDLEGEETELDRNIVEELADPLMHMVRNAIDHGIEMPEERVRAGKSATARVRLKAGHQAGHIVIQVSDDGRGLNQEQILRKALERNLVPPGAELTETEIFNLIFQPGFSTAEKVTDVSGRGVGMDVVRKQVQKLRGRMDASSVRGQGASFLMKLPLTLAIIDGLVVGVGQQRYIVPIFAVREMLKPSKDAISTVQGSHEMALVRGALAPVIRLYQRFNVKARFEKPWECLLIVSESSGRQFCLMVDELIGKQEVVIKSLGDTMQNIPGVAGGAILGDGRVGLILDLEGLIDANDRA
ncbi:MAG TPA: chemotaxis protein CheA [Bryobacteraceae bacterium]|nr:chemotaxis protein CheA [Bryobacteraceae bacterium]